jgi:GT2 family glycosyltransferase
MGFGKMFLRNLTQVISGYIKKLEFSSIDVTNSRVSPPVLEICPKVTVIIPTRDRIDLLTPCIDSILNKTSYSDFEILVIDNGSKEAESLEYFDLLRKQNIRVYRVDEKFNYSRLMNIAAGHAAGEILVFLNNDTQVISSDWLSTFAAHLADKRVAAVGARLWRGDGLLQHCGVALGVNGLASHPFAGKTRAEVDLVFKGAQNYQVSAVTFACAAVRASTYKQLGGLNEAFPVGLNDVDFCIRASSNGEIIVICGEVDLIHLESKSRKNPRRNFLGILQSTIDIMRFLYLYRDHSLQERFFKSTTQEIPR